MAYYNAVPQLLHDQWPIKKALTISDIDISHPFLTLSRQQVEAHIMVHMTPQLKDHLRAEGQVSFDTHDDDTNEIFSMKLKWRGSYYNLIGKWGKVVRTKRLEVGQEIKLRWLNSCLHFSVPQQQIVSVPPIRMVAFPLVHDSWPIRKTLTSSDVDPNHPFLPLPRKSVEEHVLAHWTFLERERLRKEEQMSLDARDYDTGEAHEMKLKWRGNYYNLIGKWGNIVRQRGLGVGQEIRLWWANSCLYFSVQDKLYVAGPGPDNWPIKKALTLSDVDTNHPFLTLPGKAVEDHILVVLGQPGPGAAEE
ncbi:Putative B3 domain-containing protein [Striga hermonthica]|uniref:B3 domain-containing protein n=1 Tax=Striga hermonthica TaxID=68872 RepID=A0A9N7P188_STRHE|nr:Putative B3 domain-containing protein [Striga hermonthica]